MSAQTDAVPTMETEQIPARRRREPSVKRDIAIAALLTGLGVVAVAVAWFSISRERMTTVAALEGQTDHVAAASGAAPEVGSFQRRVLPIPGRGALEAEFGMGEQELSLRHTPADGNESISFATARVGFPITDITFFGDATSTVLVYGRDPTKGAPTKDVVRAMIPIALPLGELEVHHNSTEIRSSGGDPAEVKEDCEADEYRSTPAERLALAEHIGAEKRAGHPDDHTATARIQKVNEFVLVEVQPGAQDAPAGEYTALIRSLLTMTGRALVADAATLSVEVGQLAGDDQRFAVVLATNGGAALEVVPEIEFEPAVPAHFAAGDARTPTYVAHLNVALPAGTDVFELTVEFEQLRTCSPKPQCWYFTVDDFGRQASISDGYEATVLWNRRLDRRTFAVLPPGRDDMAMEGLAGLPDVTPFELSEATMQQDWHGFRVRAAASCQSASVYFTPHY